MTVGSGDTLYCWVYLDSAHLPSEIMLTWTDETLSGEHRAYWGANNLLYGTDGTASRYHIGALPSAGVWTKLSIPASAVDLGGRSLTGMGFALYGGGATWDLAGKTTP